MATATIAAVGLAAGLHGALYGAYKDSPHESFLLRCFVREIAIALTVALGLALLHESASGESLFVLYVSIFALTRTATEFWKLFVRVEPQDDYRIPSLAPSGESSPQVIRVTPRFCSWRPSAACGCFSSCSSRCWSWTTCPASSCR